MKILKTQAKRSMSGWIYRAVLCALSLALATSAFAAPAGDNYGSSVAITGDIPVLLSGSADYSDGFGFIVKVPATGHILSIFRRAFFTDTQHGLLMVKESSDNGITWSAPRQMYGQAGYDASAPTGGVSSRGSVFVFFQMMENYGGWSTGNLVFLRSDDAGQTWSKPDVVPSAHAATGPLVETADSLMMAAVAQDNSPRLFVADLDGKNWHPGPKIPLKGAPKIALLWLGGQELLGFAAIDYNQPLLRLYSRDLGKSWDVAVANLQPRAASTHDSAWWMLDFPWIGWSGTPGKQVSLMFFESQYMPNVGNLHAISFDPRQAIEQPQSFGMTTILYYGASPLEFGYPSFASTSSGDFVAQFTSEQFGPFGSLFTVNGHFVPGRQ